MHHDRLSTTTGAFAWNTIIIMLSCEGQSIKLPRAEFLIVSRLARNAERFVRAEELWRFAWGEKKPFNPVSLHVYIYRLRRNLPPITFKSKQWSASVTGCLQPKFRKEAPFKTTSFPLVNRTFNQSSD